MTDTTIEAPGIPAAPPGDPRRRAIDLYTTTSLSVTAIAADVGVSRDTLYRWLHREGISIGRNGHTERAYVPSEDLAHISDEIAGLRREQIIRIGRIARLEGLIEALLGLRHKVPGRETQ
jgi:transposase-like protein